MFRPEDKHLDPLDGKLGVLLIKQLNDRSTGGGQREPKRRAQLVRQMETCWPA